MSTESPDKTLVQSTDVGQDQVEEPMIEEEGLRLSAKDARWNLKSLILFDSLSISGWGDAFLIIVPLLVYLNASNTIIGFVTGASALSWLGLVASPFLTRRFKFKKWYYIGLMAPFLGCLTAMGIALVMSRVLSIDKPHMLIIVIAAVSATWIFTGFQTVPGQEFMAACIPANLRGRLIGYSIAIGGGVSILVTLGAKWILKHIEEPICFGWVVLLGVAVYAISLIGAAIARERPTPVHKSPRAWSKDMLLAFFHDKPFVKLVVLQTVNGIFSAPVGTFVMAYGLRKAHLGGLGMAVTVVATMGIIDQVCRLSTGFIGGRLVDKLGPQRVMPFLFGMACVSMIPLLVLHHVYAVYIFVIIRTVAGTMSCSALNSLVAGIPAEENRAGHFTINYMVNYGAGTVGPVFMGFMCDKLGYMSIFIGVAVLALIMTPFSKMMLRGVVLKDTVAEEATAG